MAGFGVDGGQQVFKDLAQQFRVQRHLLLGGGVFLHGKAVAAEQVNDAGAGVVAEKQVVGDGIAGAVAGVVGKAVHADAAAGGSVKAVQAVKKAAVDEGGLGEQGLHPLRVRNFIPVAIDGEVAVVAVGAAAEPALVDFGVEGGKEQVLQHGAVVGIAGGAVVVFKQAGDLMLDEQVVGDQAFLLEEPDEQQAGDESDDVFLGRQGNGLVGGEPGGGDGAFEPGEQIPVEAAVEGFGVQGGQPGFQEAVKVAGFAVGVQPAEARRQGQVGQDVQVGAVGAGRIDFADEGDAADDIAVGVVAVGAAADEGQGNPSGIVGVVGGVVGSSEEDDHRDGEAAVEFAGQGGVAAAGVGGIAQGYGGEEEAAGVAGVKDGGGVSIKEGLLLGGRNFGAGELEQDTDGPGFPEEVGFGLGIRVSRRELAEELGRVAGLAGQGAGAAVAEGFQEGGIVLGQGLGYGGCRRCRCHRHPGHPAGAWAVSAGGRAASWNWQRGRSHAAAGGPA